MMKQWTLLKYNHYHPRSHRVTTEILHITLQVLKDQYSLKRKPYEVIQKDQLSVDFNLFYPSLSNNSDTISPSLQTQRKLGIIIKPHQTSSIISNISNQPSSFSLQDSNDQDTVLNTTNLSYLPLIHLISSNYHTINKVDLQALSNMHRITIHMGMNC